MITFLLTEKEGVDLYKSETRNPWGRGDEYGTLCLKKQKLSINTRGLRNKYGF